MRLVTLKNQKSIKKPHKSLAILVILPVVVVVALVILALRPLPAATINMTIPKETGSTIPSLAWPSVGTAATSVDGYNFIAANGDINSQVSTASIAKIITALCVLEKRPISASQSGPTITMQSADVDRYNTEIGRDGTAFPVQEADKLTERQMLQAMLLPSANNIADSLAIWAFGSMDAYHSYAKSYLAAHGLSHTTVGSDASGFDPATKSTMNDLILLGKLALKQPVVMSIAGQSQADINGNVVENHNIFAGDGFITGLKTGRNEENSGSLLWTAHGAKGNYVGIIVNAGSLYGATKGGETLARSVESNVLQTTVARRGQTVGQARTSWGSTADITAADNTSLRHWSGSKIYRYEETKPVSGTHAEIIGTLYFKSDTQKASTPLKIDKPASGPSLLWRLTHFR